MQAVEKGPDRMLQAAQFLVEIPQRMLHAISLFGVVCSQSVTIAAFCSVIHLALQPSARAQKTHGWDRQDYL